MRLTWLTVLALLVLVPTASACGGGNTAVAPLLDLNFPDKDLCKADDRTDCTVAPDYDEPFTMNGVVSWYWQVDNCEAQNPAFGTQDIIISFPEFPRNPAWMTLKMEPAELRITPQMQWDFSDGIDPNTQQITVRNDFPMKVTITRVGEPTPDEIDRALSRNGVVEMYAKAVSSESPGFQAGFAFENFKFDADAVVASNDSPSNDAPSPTMGFLIVALAALAVALRRR